MLHPNADPFNQEADFCVAASVEIKLPQTIRHGAQHDEARSKTDAKGAQRLKEELCVFATFA